MLAPTAELCRLHNPTHPSSTPSPVVQSCSLSFGGFSFLLFARLFSLSLAGGVLTCSKPLTGRAPRGATLIGAIAGDGVPSQSLGYEASSR